MNLLHLYTKINVHLEEDVLSRIFGFVERVQFHKSYYNAVPSRATIEGNLSNVLNQLPPYGKLRVTIKNTFEQLNMFYAFTKKKLPVYINKLLLYKPILLLEDQCHAYAISSTHL